MCVMLSGARAYRGRRRSTHQHRGNIIPGNNFPRLDRDELHGHSTLEEKSHTVLHELQNLLRFSFGILQSREFEEGRGFTVVREMEGVEGFFCREEELDLVRGIG